MKKFFRRGNKFASLDHVQRESMNGRIDTLLHRELVDQQGGTNLPSNGQPVNSILIEEEPSDDVSGIIFTGPVEMSNPKPLPSVLKPVEPPRVSGNTGTKTTDTLYASIVRIAKKNNTTFDRCAKALYTELPSVVQRHKEQLEACVRNPLYRYVDVDALADDLATTPEALTTTEASLLNNAVKQGFRETYRPKEEERQVELLFLRVKNLLLQGLPPAGVAGALRISDGMMERFEFRLKLEQQRNNQ